MARQRMINPLFFQDDDVAMLSPWARLLYINLWCLADREGRLEDKPGRIKIQTFPLDADVNVDGHLDELVEQDFILRYTNSGKRYIGIRTFSKYQRPHHKEAPSTFPAPDDPGSTPTSPGKVGAGPVRASASPSESESNTESVAESESFSLSLVSSEQSVETRKSPETGMTAEQEAEYADAVVQAISDRRGSDFPLPSNLDVLEIRRWMESGIPLRIALRGIEDCSKAPPNIGARYYGPAVREAYGQYRKAIA
jgi:hypothetical protein